MKENEDKLDFFGKLIAGRLRDSGIEYFDLLTKNHWKAPGLKKLQSDLKTFDAEQIQIIGGKHVFGAKMRKKFWGEKSREALS